MKKLYFLKKSLIILTITCLIATFETSCITVTSEETNLPNIISTTFETEEIVIADVVAKSPTYAVDATGNADSTQGITKALADCFALGGGTVYLPKGKYKITGNITIPPFTALRGDYNDPDKAGFNGDYGTVILADPAVSTNSFPGLFTIGGSSAAIGLTIYYTKQTVKNVKPYPYTFEIPSFASTLGHANHMAPTIRNITMINSYKGICASITTRGGLVSGANEMIHLENIKGTVLFKGAELYNSSEYGVVRGITFNNNYWANSASYFNPPSKADIDAFTSVYGIGMQLGDLEWVQFSNITIADYKIGIRLFDGLRRLIKGQPAIFFIGQFYKLNITNTMTAVRVDNMFPNFGVTFAESFLQGSLFSIRNEDQTNSLIKLVGTKLKGDTNGIRIQNSGGEDAYAQMKAAKSLPDNEIQIEPKPPKRLYNAVVKYGADKTGATDSSKAIQDALDAANADGGGIVYLSSGYYRVTKALTVYANTELRGSAAAATRDEITMSKGTLLLANFGYTSEEAAKTATALITLSGDNAGVRGLRVIYPDNEPNTSAGTIRFHSFTIRAVANNNYIVNASLAGAAFGIQFIGTAAKPLLNPSVRNVSGTYYRQGISFIYTKDGHIEEALSNASVVARNGLTDFTPEFLPYTWPSDENGKVSDIYDKITRPYSHFIIADNSSNLAIANSFTFGSKKVVTSNNSTIKIINSAGDNLYPSGGALFDITGGSLTGVNIMRYSGTALINNGGTVNLFNRISLHENTDKDVVSNNLVSPSYLSGVEKNEDDLPIPYVYVEQASSTSGNNQTASKNPNTSNNTNQSTTNGNGDKSDVSNTSSVTTSTGEQDNSTSGSLNNNSGKTNSSADKNDSTNDMNWPLIIIISSVVLVAGAGFGTFWLLKSKNLLKKGWFKKIFKK